MAYTTSPPGSQAASTVYAELLTGVGQWAYIIAIRDGRTSTATTVGVEAKGLSRSSGGTVSGTITPGQFSSLTQATYVTVNSAWSVVPSTVGNFILWLSRTEKHEAVYTWRPPRPWAAPQIIDAAMIDLRGTSASNVATFFYIQEPNHTPWRRIRRRPRHRGLWGYHNEHRAYAHSASSPAYDINRPVLNQWVAYVRGERPLLPNTPGLGAPLVLFLAATLTANPDVQAAVSRSRALLATIAASPLLSGSLHWARSLAGTISASPALSGAVTRARHLASTLTANPALVGTLTHARAFTATVSANPALTATISKARHLVSTITASPALSGVLSRAHQFAATMTAGPAITGTLSRAIGLAGRITASPSISGAVTHARQLAGTISASPNLSGVLSRVRSLSSQIAASPLIAGTLSVGGHLAATITGSPAISGSLSRAHNLSGQITASPAITGTITRIRSLGGTIVANADIQARITLAGIVHLSALIVGSPGVSAALNRTWVLAGTISGLPVISGIIDRLRTLEGLIKGSPLIEGQITWVPPFFHRPTDTITLPPMPAPVIELQARTNVISLEPPTLREIDLTPVD